jgi:hypothetical protein
MSKRYLEDFAVGQTLSFGRLRVTKEQIKAFAAEFDPQPFHLGRDEPVDGRDTALGLAAIKDEEQRIWTHVRRQTFRRAQP